MKYSYFFHILWPTVSLTCASCSAAPVSVVPQVRSYAALVRRGSSFPTVKSEMQITGLPPAALKFRAAIKTRMPRSPTPSALHGGGKPASCLSQFITRDRGWSANSAATSDRLWKMILLEPPLRRISMGGPRVAYASGCGVALMRARTAAPCAAISASVPTFTLLQQLRSASTQVYQDGGLGTAAASRITKRWQPHEAHPRQRVSLHRNRPVKQQAEFALESRRHRLRRAAACDPGGLPAACASEQPSLLKGTSSSVLVAFGRIPAAVQCDNETVPPALAGARGGARLKAVSRRHEAEGPSSDCRASYFPFVPAADNCKSRPAEKSAPKTCAQMQRLGCRPCALSFSLCSLSHRSWPTSACAIHSVVRHACPGASLLGAATFSTHSRCWGIHRATYFAGDSRLSPDSCFVACAFPLAAIGSYPTPDTPSPWSTLASNSRDATRRQAVPPFRPAPTGAQQRTSSAVPAQTKGREFAVFPVKAAASPKGTTAAGNLLNSETAAAASGWGKQFQNLPAAKLRHRGAATYTRFFLIETPGESPFYLSSYPAKQRLDGWPTGLLFTTPISAPSAGRRATVFLIHQRQHCNKVYSCNGLLLRSLSHAEVSWHKSQTPGAPSFIKRLSPSFRGNASCSVAWCVSAAAFSVTQSVPCTAGGSGARHASATRADAAFLSRIGSVSAAACTSGQTWREGGALTKKGVTTARTPGANIRATLTRLELGSASRMRHYTVIADGLECCGGTSNSVPAETVVSAKAASSTDSVDAAAETGRKLTNRKTLLSFDACTVRLPHPTKRDKGGEDASACSSRLLVVADGVGGWGMSGVDAGLYSRELVQRLKDIFEECCGEKHVQQQGQQRRAESDSTAREGAEAAGVGKSVADNTLSRVAYERTPDPVQLLKAAYLTTRAIGSSTCCLVVLDRLQKRVRCANIGDSGFILYRPSEDKIVARSNFQSHDFNFPLQLGTGSSDMPEHAHVLELPVYEGDIFLLATDGLWDNLYDEQVLEIFRRGLDVRVSKVKIVLFPKCDEPSGQEEEGRRRSVIHVRLHQYHPIRTLLVFTDAELFLAP